MERLSHRKYTGMAQQTALLSQHSVSLVYIVEENPSSFYSIRAFAFYREEEMGFVTLVHAHDIDDTCLTQRNAKLLGHDSKTRNLLQIVQNPFLEENAVSVQSLSLLLRERQGLIRIAGVHTNSPLIALCLGLRRLP